MTKIELYNYTGDFAENKDIAKDLRINCIEPNIVNDSVQLDFNNITSATQSFIHALISNVIRINGVDVLDRLYFKNCNDQIKTIINIVVDYVQDGIFIDPEDM
ncbi:MAG: hypothetical protein BGO70_10860 [Bacteroidetes bacterium 43-93]|nr:STAS-like domain-containing protein [Bacteroidota bacterium]OJW95616.1 MAG: hypothetical protein BGO70_10860 [Bacteroidetes bacterium 43-93]